MVRLSYPPTDAHLGALRAMPAITAVQWIPALARLQLDFDATAIRPGYAASDVARKLADLDVPFVELQVGKSLEGRFVEQTGLGVGS